ncbi:hypothetical protein IFO70_01805 [Phormidium tenue FACHB-886]|nr:hypothetical protein [Phormidium tenue FACHB-886]
MKQEVVQDFLNLPGIMGVAMIYGRSRPYFCGFDRLLNFQQREALAQGIQQVIETTPPGFECLELQFNGCLIHLYKLDHGIILLVLMSNTLDDPYTETISRLKAELQGNITDAIATFRHLAGTTPFLKPAPREHQEAVVAPAVPAVSPSHSLSKDLPAPLEEESLAASSAVFLHDLLAALNQLSHFSTQYLGASVVANSWKVTCPDSEWLSQFQVDRKAQISFAGQADETMLASPEQQQQLQQWVAAFIDRCGKVIRTFPKTVRQKALNASQQALLLPNP